MKFSKMEFKGKNVLVTGGGSGIGEAIAYQFAQRGTNVLLVGRREDALKRVQQKCETFGVKAWIKPTDLENQASIDALVDYIHGQNLTFDFFLLNAGVSQRALTLETDISVDRKLMEVNYFGGVYLIKKLKDMLLASQSVHIAVVSSISGIFGFPVRSAYCASKRALHGFYETLTLEYPHIKVTMLVPGRIHTDVSLNAMMGNGERAGQMDPGQANGMDVDKCARIAIRAIAKGKHEKLIGGADLLMVYFYRYCTPLYRFLAKRISAR